jgi:hypothetical protein
MDKPSPSWLSNVGHLWIAAHESSSQGWASHPGARMYDQTWRLVHDHHVLILVAHFKGNAGIWTQGS